MRTDPRTSGSALFWGCECAPLPSGSRWFRTVGQTADGASAYGPSGPESSSSATHSSRCRAISSSPASARGGGLPFGNLGGLVGPYALGVLEDATGSTTGALLELAMMAFAAAAMCLVLRRQAAFALEGQAIGVAVESGRCPVGRGRSFSRDALNRSRVSTLGFRNQLHRALVRPGAVRKRA